MRQRADATDAVRLNDWGPNICLFLDDYVDPGRHGYKDLNYYGQLQFASPSNSVIKCGMVPAVYIFCIGFPLVTILCSMCGCCKCCCRRVAGGKALSTGCPPACLPEDDVGAGEAMFRDDEMDSLLAQTGLEESDRGFCAEQLRTADIDHGTLTRAFAIGPEFLQGVLKDEGLSTLQALRIVLTLQAAAAEF